MQIVKEISTYPASKLPVSRMKAQQVIKRLKYFQWLESQSSRLLGGWLPGIVRWETKHAMGLHIWQDAQHSSHLRMRLWELRVPNPDRDIDRTVVRIIQCFASAQDDYEFLAGVYLVLKAELISAYKSVVQHTAEIYDAPTVAVIQNIVSEKVDQLEWARHELDAMLNSEEKRRKAARWTDYCRTLIQELDRIIEGSAEDNDTEATLPPGYSLRLPFAGARRDERFKMNLRGMDDPVEGDRKTHLLYQFFNYSQEMQAAETLGSMLWETQGMEWEFYFDVSRHCYDEVRHSALGEARLRQLGYQVTDFPNTVANYVWRQLLDPLRRYCVLTCVIEADGFKYKQHTYEEHVKNCDLESAEAVLYDIMDETMHVRWGQKWVPKMMKAYGYEGSLEALIGECRDILIANSVSTIQRLSSKR